MSNLRLIATVLALLSSSVLLANCGGGRGYDGPGFHGDWHGGWRHR
jgi:hypothetical protein